MDMIRDHFEIVKCKQINGYRILKVMKKIGKYYYHYDGDGSYKDFQEFKDREYYEYCLNFIELEQNSLSRDIN